MTDQTKGFGDVAQRLAKNPLGIIALFIVLVYGFAALVTGLGGSLSSAERFPLIYFLVLFPVLVLAVFAWLVSRHHTKLYGPSDFRDDESYLRTIEVATSLAVATQKSGSTGAPADLHSLLRTVREAEEATARRRGQVLWVDDNPEYNVHERRAFERMGVTFELARSTDEAVRLLARDRFGAIISDMGRREGPREGYVLLERIRRSGDRTPFFIYSSSDDPEHEREARERGAQGSTGNPQRLFQLVMQAIVNR